MSRWLSKLLGKNPPKDGRKTTLTSRTDSHRGGDPKSVVSNRVYVGNLSCDVSEQDLKELFKGIGGVRKIELASNSSTKRSIGYGFVEMFSMAEALRAVEVLHDQPFLGQNMIVSGAELVNHDESESEQDSQQSDLPPPEDSIQAAFEGLAPVYLVVFKTAQTGATIPEIAKRWSMTENAATNILETIRLKLVGVNRLDLMPQNCLIPNQSQNPPPIHGSPSNDFQVHQRPLIPQIIQEATEPPPVVVADRDGDAFHSIHIGRKTKISFHRTLRVPEDGNDYPLPAGLGAFPIHRVEDYADNVPPQWLEEGGFFIPLYQREALFIQFEGEEWCPSIAKVCVGQINAITGKQHSDKLSRHNQDYVVIPKQEWLDGINSGDGTVKQFVAMPLGRGYTVEAQITDEEKHGGFQLVVYEPIDGRFRITPDSANKMVEYIIAACLKKFDLLLSQSNAFQRKIVTSVQEGKLTCSGISFITGLENERVEYLYQEFRKNFFEIVANTTSQYIVEDKDKFLDVSLKVFFGLRSLGLREDIDPYQDKKVEKLPREGVLMSSPAQGDFGNVRLGSSPAGYNSREAEEMGIAAGGRIKQQIFSDTYGVESWDYNRRRTLKLHIVNSVDYKIITGQDPPLSPISADHYQRSGIPWFSNYNETAESIKGVGSLKRILGVDEIDKRRGNRKTSAEQQPTITPQLIQRIKTPDIYEAAHEFRSRASESIATGRWKVAIREIDYLIDLGVSAEAADYAVRAYGNFQIERFLEAVMDADTALDLDAGLYEVLVTRARCRLALGDLLGSKEDAQLLTQVQGRESVGYELMAEANLLLSDYAGAISDAFFATLFDPKNRRAQEISSQARNACNHSENKDDEQ